MPLAYRRSQRGRLRLLRVPESARRLPIAGTTRPSRTTRPPAAGGTHELSSGSRALQRRHWRPGASPDRHRRALAGFLAASSFEHCGPRLLSMAIGVGLVAPAAGGVAARIMRFDAFGAIVFVILATLFVLAAGPMMDQCRPWILRGRDGKRTHSTNPHRACPCHRGRARRPGFPAPAQHHARRP